MSEEGPAKEVLLDKKRQAEARRYSNLKRRLYLMELGLSAVLLGIMVFSGLSRYLVKFIDLPQIPAAVFYFVFLMLAYTLITFPVTYYSGFILPRRYGLTRQCVQGWLAVAL